MVSLSAVLRIRADQRASWLRAALLISKGPLEGYRGPLAVVAERLRVVVSGRRAAGRQVGWAQRERESESERERARERERALAAQQSWTCGAVWWRSARCQRGMSDASLVYVQRTEGTREKFRQAQILEVRQSWLQLPRRPQQSHPSLVYASLRSCRHHQAKAESECTTQTCGA
eukprot:COSAG03_NODE_8_length_24035_cov_36.331885_17_plen_174_part_00